MSTTILVTSAGGPAATGFVRSLRKVRPALRIIGTEANVYKQHLSECDRTVIVPYANSPHYLRAIQDVIAEFGVTFIHSQADVELMVLSEARERLGADTFLPAKETMNICRNKWRSYKRWKTASIAVPQTFLLHNAADLRRAFDQLSGDMWLRDTEGAAGQGSLSRPTYSQAWHHLTSRNMWGKATAARHLTRDTVTWQSIWDEGWLVCAQGRRRLGWEFGNRTQSGVTGLTAVARLIADPMVDRIAMRAIKAIDPRPHGIFSVDMTYDDAGVPNPTEINAGRFFTTHQFITEAGLNMPHILLQLMEHTYSGRYRLLNPCRRDVAWVRGIDVEPKMVPLDD